MRSEANLELSVAEFQRANYFVFLWSHSLVGFGATSEKMLKSTCVFVRSEANLELWSGVSKSQKIVFLWSFSFIGFGGPPWGKFWNRDAFSCDLRLIWNSLVEFQRAKYFVFLWPPSLMGVWGPFPSKFWKSRCVFGRSEANRQLCSGVSKSQKVRFSIAPLAGGVWGLPGEFFEIEMPFRAIWG